MKPKVCCCKHCDDIFCEDNPNYDKRYEPRICNVCDGTGKIKREVLIRESSWLHGAKYEERDVECPICGGSGEYDPFKEERVR